MQNLTQLWKSQDLFAALGSLSTAGDPVKVSKSCADLVQHLYWKEKNLPALVAASCSGISYALFKANEQGNDELARELRGLAKAMCYDLGSFTWPGWDEPGIVIGPSDLAIGREAAKANLRLAGELERGDLPLSRAYWLVAAHDLAAGDYGSARAAFQRSADLARSAGEDAEALMSAAYVRVAEALADPADEKKLAAVAEADEKIGSVDGGKEFQGQVPTALRIFLDTQTA